MGPEPMRVVPTNMDLLRTLAVQFQVNPLEAMREFPSVDLRLLPAAIELFRISIGTVPLLVVHHGSGESEAWEAWQPGPPGQWVQLNERCGLATPVRDGLSMRVRRVLGKAGPIETSGFGDDVLLSITLPSGYVLRYDVLAALAREFRSTRISLVEASPGVAELKVWGWS